MNTPATFDTNQVPSADQRSKRREERNRLEEEIAELSARIDAAIYELLVRIRRFDELQGWAGQRSYAQWLSWRANLAPGTAREYVRVAHALATLPKVSDALRRGRISYSKVRAITRAATPATEERLLHLARRATAADLERIVRAWRLCDRQHEGREDTERRRNHTLSIYPDADGMFVVRGLLTPEVGAVVRRAIEAASEQLYQESKDAETRNVEAESPARRRADAFGLIAESALAAKLDSGTAGERYQVVVHVDPDTLKEGFSAETSPSDGQATLEEADGIRVSAETSRRVACDAGTVMMHHDADGNILDVGRKDSHHFPRVAPGPGVTGPALPLPRLRSPAVRRPPYPPLGGRRRHEAEQPRAALPPAPPRGARGGLRPHARHRRPAAVHAAGRRGDADGALPSRLDRRPARADGHEACRGRHPHPPPNLASQLVRRAA